MGAALIGFGKAVAGLWRSNQSKRRVDEQDQRTLKEFFFGAEKDPRIGTPAKEGWTTKVDRQLAGQTRQLEQLRVTQHQTSNAVQQILYELTPNGGSNFRGKVERAMDNVAEGTHENNDQTDTGDPT